MEQFNIKDIDKPYKIKQENFAGFKIQLQEKTILSDKKKRKII